ncbi:ATP-binding protein [Inconstantimicrobium mannanitabidum]|uniref:DNA replication protein DnaC n=1 Tax=Inconstantimicrobium mannanitabidum TaxID=1604901 RepID=A0ACB5RHA2_9CLOT|nr:ATP-binding protein [Clostridium sp. TW13]GKX68470.1 DNA replication protein DnaC [Clostridium sp. TW13]
MIKGYKSQLMDYYEKIRNDEIKALNNRKKEISDKYPQIIAIDNEIGKLSIKLSLTIIKNSDNVQETLEELKDKITDLRVRKAELLVQHNYPQDYLMLRYQCEACKDTGYIGTKKCSCFYKQLVKIYYKNSQLSDALQTNNFTNFNVEYYTTHKLGDEKFSPRKNIETILNYVLKDYIPNFNSHNDNLLFYGNSGTGKTFMSHCIAKELLDKGFLVTYRTSDELIKNLKQITFEGDTALEDLLINCDLLIIDDLGAEQITDFSVTEFFTFLNKKLLGKKKMLISTNLTLPQLSKSYTERITSRLFGSFKLQKFYTEDIRVKKNLSKK